MLRVTVVKMERCTVIIIVLSLVYAFLMQYSFVAETEWRKVLRVNGDPQKSLNVAWNILYDFESYSKWNTFTYKIVRDTDNKDYAMIFVKLKQPFFEERYFNLSSKFKFIEITENERICWSYQMVPELIQPFILKTKRCMEIKIDDTDDDNKYVLLRHYDLNQGPLSPLVQLLFQSNIETGFETMTDDFVKYISKISEI